MLISVICVYNNEEQFNNQLLKSLNMQNAKYELIVMDNRDRGFSSMAAALNQGVENSNGEILVFAHQDIFFKGESELREFADSIGKCRIGSIIGTQGVIDKSNRYYTNLTSGIKYNPVFQSRYEKGLYEVSCVDEGLFGMKKATWERHKFDEILCDNWHLYCVESCLFNRKHGAKVYVFPSQIHHFSKGTISLGYMNNLKRLCQHYRKDFRYIWTTCYKVRTSSVYINGLVTLWIVNRAVRGTLKQ